MHHVYILRCSDNTFYKGITSNLEQRMEAHRKGKVKYTQTRLSFKLETYISFTDKSKAFAFEKYLKVASGEVFMFKRLVTK